MKSLESNSRPKQVAILGAGPSGLTTAWELSSINHAANEALYDITIYDMSWRPGGKCASGRTASADRRIVQNGTHYVFGVYFNMFKIVKEAYAILNGNAQGTSDAHAGWGGTDEFNARNVLALKDKCVTYPNWNLVVPCKDPGELPDPSASVLPTAAAVFDFLLDLIESYTFVGAFNQPVSLFMDGQYALHRTAEIRELPIPKESPGDDQVNQSFRATRAVARALRKASVERAPIEGLLHELQPRVAELRLLMDRSVGAVRVALQLQPKPPLGCQIDRLDQVLDFALTLSAALLVEGVLLGGTIERLDKKDVRLWLKDHGLKVATFNSPLTLAWYDAVAAYADGDASKPSFSAAAFLQSMIPAVLTYRGCFIYQMMGEVGENFTGPIYQVLRDRGVKFRWLHRATSLELSSDGEHVDRVDFELPVYPPEPSFAERFAIFRGNLQYFLTNNPASLPPTRSALLAYDPVIRFPLRDGKQRCAFREFPIEPFKHVLPDDTPANTWYAPKPTPCSGFSIARNGAGSITPDGYDVLVFALPHTVVPHIAPQLRAAKSTWRDLELLPAIETRSLRLWLKPPFEELKWDADRGDQRPVLATFRKQFFVWEDSGQQLDVHTWPSPVDAPRSIATVFAPQPAPQHSPTREGDPDYVRTQLNLARTSADTFMRDEAGRLWLGVASGPGIDPSEIVDPPSSGSAPSGFALVPMVGSGFVIANAGPLERYVHAAPNTYHYRIDPFLPGFKDFYVAGDWVRLWPAVGNMEQAVLAGRIAGLLIHGVAPADFGDYALHNYPGFFPD